MKGIVIYRSKTGYTKKYAEALSQHFNYDLLENKKINFESLKKYETIIYGGSLYASGILGMKKLIIKNLDRLSDKKLIVFAVGATPGTGNDYNEIVSSNFTKDQFNKIDFHYARGGFDFSKLNWFDKLLMLLLKFKIKLKPKGKRTSDETGMLNAYSQRLDFVNNMNIERLIKSIEKNKG